MKIRWIVSCSLGLLLVHGTALAQTPAEIAQQIIAQMGKHQSLDPAVEAIDWDGAFNALDPEMKKQMVINSPEDLKRNQLENYKGSGEKVQEGVERALTQKDPAQEFALKAMRDRLKTSLAEQAAKSKRDFSETTYALGESKVGATEAQVEVRKTRGENTTTSTLEFVKVNGNWKLKSAAPLSPTGGNATYDAPGELLGPSIASPNEAVLRLH